MLKAGHSMPEGLVVASAAYSAFVDANGLEPRIEQVLASARADDPESLEGCSRGA